MKRRFLQFSLRGLLGFAAVVCLALGGRHLLETYGNSIEVRTARVGEPLRLKARYFCVLGPAERHLGLACEAADKSWLAEGVYGSTHSDIVKRSWLCLYTMEADLYPVTRRCQVVVSLDRLEEVGPGETEGTLLKETTVDVN